MIFTMRKTRRTRKKLNALVRDENFIAKKRARVKGENPNILALSICEGEIPLFRLILRLCSEEDGSEEIRGLLFAKEL